MSLRAQAKQSLYNIVNMNVTVYKTHKIVAGDKLFAILDKYLPKLQENDVVVITSKIVSICEGRLIKNDGSIDKYDLIHREADQYIDKDVDRYHVMITTKFHNLVANSGIDESNGNGYFILWPENPDASAESIWSYLRKTHHLNHLGVLITDSHINPLRWGVTGFGVSWCGFEPLNDCIGKPDIFGRMLRMTKVSVLDGLSASAVIVMGESNEQTPLAVIRDVPFVQFMDRAPTKQEREGLQIELKDDIYAPILTTAPWKKGK